jgi:hypothetical protein
MAWNGKSFSYWEMFIDLVHSNRHLYVKSEPLYCNREVVKRTWCHVSAMAQANHGSMTGKPSKFIPSS